MVELGKHKPEHRRIARHYRSLKFSINLIQNLNGIQNRALKVDGVDLPNFVQSFLGGAAVTMMPFH